MPLPLVGAVAGGAARLGARSLIGRTAARGMMMGMGGGGGSGINVPVTTVAEIKLTSNVEGINARMSNLVMKQIRFATAQALTQTAKNLVAQNERDTRAMFESPTKWNTQAFSFEPAKINHQSTVIKRKDKPATTNVPRNKQNYLERLDDGGGRQPKAFEGALKTKKGANKFNYALPTRDTRLNKFGNITRNQVDKILGEVGQKGSKLFIPRSGSALAIKGGDGVFERMARNKVKKSLHLVNTIPNYQAEFRFYPRMNAYARKQFPKTLQRKFQAAIRSARGIQAPMKQNM